MVPSVVISAETRRREMQKPLNRPQAAPASKATTVPTNTVPAPSVPIASIVFAAATPANTSTEPIDRSKPPAIIT